jgi:hypothetical protein
MKPLQQDTRCEHNSTTDDDCAICMEEELAGLEAGGIVYMDPNGKMELFQMDPVHECHDPESCAWCHAISIDIRRNKHDEYICTLKDGSTQIFSAEGEFLR